jgi:Zn-dependent M28 family amino/carboxypeptidase
VGLLRGSDPDLSRQTVVLTAHHDHLGIGQPVEGDSIYNGALDNASGLSMMLNIGQALAAMEPRPKRSVLLCAVAAEEYGLLGSEYFAAHPTIPLRDIAAVINIDGINIWGRTRDIIFLGSDRSSLGQDIDAVAEVMEMEVKPDQFPEHGSFYRSDHFSFAKVGVPCLSVDGGIDYIGKPADFAKTQIEEFIARHYHQPSDELSDDWDYSGAIQQAEFVIRLVKRIGDASGMPRWNAGDEFEAARLKTPGAN